MKVKELIEHLKTLDQDATVFVRGYEGGYNTVTNTVEKENFKLNVNTEWYYGAHEEVDEDEDFDVEGYVL
jgi:hypothetical protein